MKLDERREQTIRGYLETVAEQIRWKKARPVVARELEHHLEDQRDDFAAAGHPPEEAERLAVEEMGDPVAVGTALDGIHRPRPQWGLLGLTLLLALAGAVLRVALTRGWEYQAIHPLRSLLLLALGAACLVGGYALDYSRLARHAGAVYLGALAAGMLSLWLSPVRNNVSYYTRYLVLVYPTVYALWLYACRGRDRGWLRLALAVAGGVPLAALCALVPSTQALLVLLVTGAVLLLLAVRMDWFGVPRGRACALVLGLAGAMAAAGVYHAWPRLYQAFHPECDPMGRGYQAMTVRSTLRGAKWVGEGTLGAPYAGFPYGYEEIVPGANTDFFPTTLIHALGWLPFLLLVLAVSLLLLWLLRRCLRQRNQAGRLLALSVGLSLGLQAAFGVTLNLGLVLFSAQVPFLTGNFHTAVCMGLVGLALSVFRTDALAWEDAQRPTAPLYRESV